MRLKVLVLKEWAELFRIKMVLFGCTFMPLFMGGFAGYMVWQGRGLPPEGQAALFNAALLYFLILPVMIPVTLAVYSVVGEKEQGTLEPLLATPLSDLELFLGKSIVAVVPAVLLTWGVFGLFLIFASQVIPGGVPEGVLSLPWLLSIFALSPLMALFAALVAMIISSRSTDSRAAYQFAGLAVVPSLVPLIVYSARLTAVDLKFVGIEGGILLVLNAVLLFLGVKIFQREEILIRWK
ncbi:ABC transporter permease [Candidatus Bipolaricaulota bacterium]|nr:ABC transporter permease [Candidatus Bipolaricaulota bacterium]